MASNFGLIVVRVALIAPLIGVWLVLHAAPSYACSCVLPGSPSGELAKSTAVFTGQVVSVRESDKGLLDWSSSDPTMVEFDVRTVWKGSNYQTIYLTTARSSASCGFTFIEGVEYVVYSRDGSTVSLCSRTRTRSEAAHDLAEMADLGTGRLPAQGASAPRPDVSGGRCGLSPDTTDLSVVGLMVGIAWLGLRKKPSDTR